MKINTVAKGWLRFLALALITNASLNATWENDMMQTFEFSDDTLLTVDNYLYGDGSSPTWYTFQTFTFDTSATDSGFIFFTGSIMSDGYTQPPGVFAISLDGTILGTDISATDGWGINKFNIFGAQFTVPATGWSDCISMIWPITTSLLPAGTHTLELLGSCAFDFSGYGWSLSAGTVMAFVGFPNSAITN